MTAWSGVRGFASMAHNLGRIGRDGYRGAVGTVRGPRASIEIPRNANAIGNAAAQRNAMNQNRRAERAIERTRHERHYSGHRTAGDAAIDTPGPSQGPGSNHRAIVFLYIPTLSPPRRHGEVLAAYRPRNSRSELR
jgi:hypothetical protein